MLVSCPPEVQPVEPAGRQPLTVIVADKFGHRYSPHARGGAASLAGRWPGDSIHIDIRIPSHGSGVRTKSWITMLQNQDDVYTPLDSARPVIV